MMRNNRVGGLDVERYGSLCKVKDNKGADSSGQWNHRYIRLK
jgi:hypothetical protein